MITTSIWWWYLYHKHMGKSISNRWVTLPWSYRNGTYFSGIIWQNYRLQQSGELIWSYFRLQLNRGRPVQELHPKHHNNSTRYTEVRSRRGSPALGFWAAWARPSARRSARRDGSLPLPERRLTARASGCALFSHESGDGGGGGGEHLRGRVAVLRQEEKQRLLRPRRRGISAARLGDGTNRRSLQRGSRVAQIRQAWIGPGLNWAGLYTGLITCGLHMGDANGTKALWSCYNNGYHCSW
jgi:hypothetical protein